VKSGRHPVGDKLAIRFAQSEPHVEHDLRSRHDLTLKGIAVNIDDSRQHQQSGRVDPADGPGACVPFDSGDRSVCNMQGRGHQPPFAQHAPALDNPVSSHDPSSKKLACHIPVNRDAYSMRTSNPIKM